MIIGALGEATEVLDKLGISYVLTGGLAVGYHEYHRRTLDVDFLIPLLNPSQADAFTEILATKDKLLDTVSTKRTLINGGIFRVTWREVSTVDFIVKPNIEHILKRAEEEEGVKIISLEDLILGKLSVIRDLPRGSIRLQDPQDIASLLAIRAKDIDWRYLTAHAKREDTFKILNLIRRRSVK